MLEMSTYCFSVMSKTQKVQKNYLETRGMENLGTFEVGLSSFMLLLNVL